MGGAGGATACWAALAVLLLLPALVSVSGVTRVAHCVVRLPDKPMVVVTTLRFAGELVGCEALVRAWEG